MTDSSSGADGYYDEDAVEAEELDLSFLDDEEESSSNNKE